MGRFTGFATDVVTVYKLNEHYMFDIDENVVKLHILGVRLDVL